MGIDIVFVIMTVWGFYFGYTHGPIRVFLFVISLLLALTAAMRYTPTTAQLIRGSFETDSPFLPFLAFTLTLLSVLFMLRIVSLILLETIKNERFNTGSQFVGGVIMCLTFVFLYSVLVRFFSEANVINIETAKRTSFSYQYISKIPEGGREVLRIGTPFLEDFIEYMNRSIQQLNQSNRVPRRMFPTDTTQPQTVPTEMPATETEPIPPQDTTAHN
jgi:membrane protein required for colicin V production